MTTADEQASTELDFAVPSLDYSDQHVPVGVDVNVPHSARIYNYWTGGKDNFASDRGMAAAIEQAIPSIRAMANANRDFMIRVVRYLAAEAGIHQFLDIGTGIPAQPNVHDIAQAVAPGARVVYADNDPIVLVHARALMVSTGEGTTAYAQADLRDAVGILKNPDVTSTLDLTKPVALLLIAILMLVDEDDDPLTSVRELLDALPSGSYLVITHPTGDFDPPAMDTVVATARHGGMTFTARSRDQVAKYFEGLELVEPGVVPVLTWHPEGGQPEDPHAAYYWAGVARKP